MDELIPRQKNDWFYDEFHGCYLIVIGGQIVKYAETITQAEETFKETMRVQREHIKRNPENKEL